MGIHSPEFKAVADRVVRATELTSRLNVLPFDDKEGEAELFERIFGRPLPSGVTIYPPFFTDHGLRLDLAERVPINQNRTFLDYAGVGDRFGCRASVRAQHEHTPPEVPPTISHVRPPRPVGELAHRLRLRVFRVRAQPVARRAPLRGDVAVPAV